MPNASLTFSLPEEQHEHICALYGLRFYATLREADEHLRGLLKHESVNQYTARRLAEEIRAMISADLALIEA